MAIVFCFLMSSHIYKMNFLYLYYSIFLISFHTPVLFFWYLFICLYRFRYSYTFLFFGYFSSFHDVFFFIPILFCHFLLSSFENAFFINKHYSFFFVCVFLHFKNAFIFPILLCFSHDFSHFGNCHSFKLLYYTSISLYFDILLFMFFWYLSITLKCFHYNHTFLWKVFVVNIHWPVLYFFSHFEIFFLFLDSPLFLCFLIIFKCFQCTCTVLFV